LLNQTGCMYYIWIICLFIKSKKVFKVTATRPANVEQTYCNVMISKYRLWDAYELRAIPKRLQKRWTKTAKPFICKLWNIKVQTPFGERRYMEIDKINTMKKLVREVRRVGGFGTFAVFFWNPNQRNKKYKKRFRCIKKRCKWYRSCRLKNRNIIGIACKRNSKYKANWCPRMKLVIHPNPKRRRDQDIDFTFKIIWSRMHYIKWFGRK